MSESDQSHAKPGGDSIEHEISPWRLLALAIRIRSWVVGSALFFGAAIVFWGLLQPRTWTAETAFRPQGGMGQVGQLTSLATQFGISLNPSSEGDSPRFYADLVQSQSFMLAVASRPISTPSGDPVQLFEVAEIEGDSDGELLERTAEWLREQVVSVSTAVETGVVTVSVKTNWPEVSLAIADQVVHELNRFNTEVRQSQATAERDFVESQLALTRTELSEAEGSLRSFLESNRQFENSPRLRFEHDRLQREVQMRQQLFTSLNQAFQQARISEVRNTPVINVFQPPIVAVRPDRRGLLLKLLTGLILGGGIGFILGASRNASPPRRPEDRQALDEIRSFVRDVRTARWREAIFGGRK